MPRVFIICVQGRAFIDRDAFSGPMAQYLFRTPDGRKVVIREPRLGDAPQYMRLINEIMDEPGSGILMDRHSTLAEERRWVRARIEGIRRKKIVMLSAVVDGVIKGNCDVDRQGWKKAHRAIIGVVIAKDLRGKGVGEELMRRTIALAEKRLKGIEYIDLAVFDYNKRARALYSKLGFEEIARIPKAVKEGPRYRDELIMTKRVGSARR